MILTGKCKEDFKKWLNDKRYFIISIEDDFQSIWFNCSDSMKYGVYVDFFDSVGIYIELQVHTEPTMSGHFYKNIRPVVLFKGRLHNTGASSNRISSRLRAIDKANLIYNDL